MSTKVKAEGSGTSGAGKEGDQSQVDGKPNEGKSGTEGEDGGTVDAGSGEKKVEGDDSELDVSKLDPKAQKLIKDLRKENADTRRKAKLGDESLKKLKQGLVEAGIIESDDEAPEEKIKTLSAQNEMSSFNSAVLESAIEHGISKADVKYFRFLVQEKLSSLEEGEELDDEGMAELAKQARRSASSGSSGNTSVNSGKEGGGAPAPGESGDLTFESFLRMNVGEKSGLYVKNKDLYQKFMDEAKSKKMLV